MIENERRDIHNSENNYPTPLSTMQTPHRRKGVFIFIIFFGVSVSFFAFNFFTSVPSFDSHSIKIIKKSAARRIISPTPMPFEELTIPYLQKRLYQSELGPLEKEGEFPRYTSYTTWYSSDNLRINGLLTKPIGEVPEKGWPAIIFIHGYIPPQQYKTTQNYASYVNTLAKEGFVVFKIDLRGHGNSEGEPGGAYYSSDYIVDTLNAMAALQKTDFVDPNNIGLWGHSMAGNVVIRSLVAKPNIAAAVIWAGAVYTYDDMQKYGIDDNSYRPPSLSTPRQQKRQQLREIYGEFNAKSPFWSQVAVTQYVSHIKIPIQIHHAVDDAVVNVGYSRDIMKLLDQSSVRHELYEYSSGGHNLSGSTFNQAMQKTIQFYNEELLMK